MLGAISSCFGKGEEEKQCVRYGVARSKEKPGATCTSGKAYWCTTIYTLRIVKNSCLNEIIKYRGNGYTVQAEKKKEMFTLSP